MQSYDNKSRAPVRTQNTDNLSYSQWENSINTGELTRFIIKLFAYLAYALLVVVDGLNNPESYETKFLTLPYLIGGLALTRSICEALDHHYDGHAAIFAMGLSTLGALA